jgi:large subunit ribosomal protein L24
MATVNIKKGDTVYVLAGRSRQSRLTPDEAKKIPVTEQKAAAERNPGRRGKVLRVMPSQNKVLVEGVNLVIKHSRRNPRGGRMASQQTGRVEQPSPLDISNVMLICPRCDKPTKARRQEHQGQHLRVCRHCNQVIDQAR